MIWTAGDLLEPPCDVLEILLLVLIRLVAVMLPMNSAAEVAEILRRILKRIVFL